MIPFVKMQSLGNDILLLPHEVLLDKTQIQNLCHRRFGLGCDQLAMLGGRTEQGHYHLYFWNQDGSIARACGNGTRCAVAFLWQQQGASSEKIQMEGLDTLWMGWKENDEQVSVQQGEAKIGVIRQKDAHSFQSCPMLSLESYGIPDGIPVDVGNAHLVVFSAPPPNLDALGAALSCHPAFPHGVNLAFVDEDPLHVTFWEHGVGRTLSCGSGACAAAAALCAIRRKEWPLEMAVPGGTLWVTQDQGQWIHTAPVSLAGYGWCAMPKQGSMGHG
jgi:diaminopimelate epimerase